MAKIAQGLKGRVLRKKFFLPIEFWIFTFLFCSCICMISPSMWLLWFECEIFYYFQEIIQSKSTMLRSWMKTPINKRNFSSLIIMNMEFRFEPCVLNLIWKWCAKDPKKRKDHLIFINFKVKKFTIKNIQKKRTLLFGML